MIEENTDKEYQQFLQVVLEHREVWILQNDEGMACQHSIEYDGKMAVLLWSNCMLAENEREGEFEELETSTLTLYEFLFHWLPNMAKEDVVCGLNWNADDGGLEVEPHDLLEHFKMIIPDELADEYRKRLARETC